MRSFCYFSVKGSAVSMTQMVCCNRFVSKRLVIYRHFFIPGHLIIRIIKLSFGREVLAANSLLNLKEISSAAPGQYRSDKSPSRCVPRRSAARGTLPSLPVECFSIGLGDKGGTSCLPKAYGPAEREDLNLIT